MSLDLLGDLNWLAVVVATMVYFALGGLWYAPPVFGNAWMRAARIQMPEGQRPGPGIDFTPLIGVVHRRDRHGHAGRGHRIGHGR